MHQQDQADDTGGGFLTQPLSDHAMAAPKDQALYASRNALRTDPALGERIDAASRATRALAFPPAEMPTPATGDDDVEEPTAATGDDAQILATLRVLTDLALPDTSAAFTAAGKSSWRPSAGTSAAGPLNLDLADAPALRRGDSLVASRTRQTRLWQALVAWRETTARVERIALVPVLIDEQVYAIFALGFAGTLGIHDDWLPIAGAVANACAAGIAVRQLRLRLVAEAQARDAYISLAAHELRSPITSIKGYAQLLMRQARKSSVSLPEAMTRSVESIEQQSSRMAEMIGELLDASRIRRGSLELLPRSADLIDIVRGAVERRGPRHPQQTFTFESHVTSLIGRWDTARVEQVVRDLLDNAARHSPDEGHVTTRIVQEGNLAVVTVHDEGIGIARDDQAHIFDYLYRSPASIDRNLAGLGLGLFVSRNIVERHGGQLELSATRTEAPTGSEFRFTLPIDPSSALTAV